MPPSRNRRGGGGGRILPRTRDTDDSTPTVTGAGISAAHAAAIFTTSDQGLNKRVRNNHQARIRRFITFLFENYGDIYEQCTIIVSPKDRLDASLYYTLKRTSETSLTQVWTPCIFLLFFLMQKQSPVGNWHLTLTCQSSTMP
jgi:hypothetical protein